MRIQPAEKLLLWFESEMSLVGSPLEHFIPSLWQYSEPLGDRAVLVEVGPQG